MRERDLVRRLNSSSVESGFELGEKMLRTLRYVPLALIVVSGFGSTACASQLYGQRGVYRTNIDRRAYDNGYREGVHQGENDVRRGRNYSPNSHSEYRNADDGYRRGDGDREFYRSSYRQGFDAGYSESFNRYGANGRYPRSYPTDPSYPTNPSYPTYPSYPNGRAVPRGGTYYSPAGQNGYRDGLDEGRNDARDRRAFDPVRTKRYRDGDHDYNGRYGSKDEYKREYRAAFEQGYRDGYEGTRRF
jgi:hypothetical protein